MGGLEAALLQTHACRTRRTSVLVAAMSSREGQRPAFSEPATARAIAGCLQALGAAAEASGGRVLRTRDGELIALFSTTDAAAAAAARMQHEAARLVPSGDMGLRAGFHSGPLRQRGNGVFGDTINLAAELASRAAPGQILTSAESAASLGAGFHTALHGQTLHAERALPALCELDWREFGPASLEGVAKRRLVELHLIYRYVTLLRRREGDSVTVGRDPDCDLCVDMRLASRRHCTLERRDDKVLLRDHSTNGTFITVDGGRERRIRGEECVLHARGWLSFGASRLLAEDLMQFRCQ